MIKYKLSNQGKSYIKYKGSEQIASGLTNNLEFIEWIDSGNEPEPEFTEEELARQELAKQLEQRKAKMIEGEVYTLNNVDYPISFTKDDGDGLVQVKSAFDLGLTSTIIHFENGTKLPITSSEFPEFALWFVEKRNSFFEV